MELKDDPGQRTAPTVGSLEPSHLWVLGLDRDDAGPPIEEARRPYSYLAECDCPDDCPRDHANE
jgi:hypothetical protein